jgi:hypothetical protein
MGWHHSEGDAALEHPSPCDDVELGDLFVHAHGTSVQVWMRSDNGWDVIRAGHAHPSLIDHRLLIKDGKPSWVTRQTVATYSYRKK